MSNSLSKKIAVVHDWLPVVGGAEKVVRELTRSLNATDVYAVFDFLSKSDRNFLFGDTPVHTSLLNRLPYSKYYYRHLLLLATRAVEAFDLTKHEIVVSSSAAISKGVITSPEQLHVSYVHSPARYAWDMTHEYISDLRSPFRPVKQMIAHEVMHRFRIWDMRTISSIDYLIANSKFVQNRIWKLYRRESDVIYPPVDLVGFNLNLDSPDDYYFTVSRMVPYKKMHLLIEAFSRRPRLRLVMAGDGPEFRRMRSNLPANVQLIGRVGQDELVTHMQKCRAFVFAAKEDFGILPVEAQACGTPVIALNSGGTAETVLGLNDPNPTGVLFKEQSVASILEAIDTMEDAHFHIKRSDCRRNAVSFNTERFHKQIKNYIAERYNVPKGSR